MRQPTLLMASFALLLLSGIGGTSYAGIIDSSSITGVAPLTNYNGPPPGSELPPGEHSVDWGDITGKPAWTLYWPHWDDVRGKPEPLPFALNPHDHGDDYLSRNEPFLGANCPDGSYMYGIYDNGTIACREIKVAEPAPPPPPPEPPSYTETCGDLDVDGWILAGQRWNFPDEPNWTKIVFECDIQRMTVTRQPREGQSDLIVAQHIVGTAVFSPFTFPTCGSCSYGNLVFGYHAQVRLQSGQFSFQSTTHPFGYKVYTD